MSTTNTETIVLSGASGFIGSLILDELAARTTEVRCISRNPDTQFDNLPAGAKPMQGDLLDLESLRPIFRNANVGYYLVHALDDGGPLLEAEVQAARNFAQAAAEAGLRRIIYLGALAESSHEGTSAHIISRHKVGDVLRESGVPVTEFQASIVIGNGSMPFEVVRALVERLPVMITPRWVQMRLQPISSQDVASYLLAALEVDGQENNVYEIGGSNVVTYQGLLRAYEKVRGLRRIHIQVPVITPRLSSHWLRLVTPAHFKMARRIVESAGHDSIVRTEKALEDFQVRPMSVEQAIESAVSDESQHWSHMDMFEQMHDTRETLRKRKFGNHFIEQRRIWVDTPAEECFEIICSLGGDTGWYWGDWLWKLRGVMDTAFGGTGLRRHLTPLGRPEPGAVLDFWRVQNFIEGERLTLKAEMKLPGTAWLDFRVRPATSGCWLEQTVVFASRGLSGQLYWKAVQPIHSLVFDGMLREMSQASLKISRAA